jgi:formylglycine-generating enzyme required for sulfatase activity
LIQRDNEPLKDPYKILEVEPDAETAVIEAAYRGLAKRYHPDVNPSPDAHEKMKDINWAHDILRDPGQREAYRKSRKKHQKTSTEAPDSYAHAHQRAEEMRRRREAEKQAREKEAERQRQEEEKRKQGSIEPSVHSWVALAPKVGMEFIKVSAGEFWMGSDPKKDREAMAWEKPQHKVFLEDYWIGRCLVTNRQYQAFVKETNHIAPPYWELDEFPSGKQDHPVVEVCWDDIQAFLQWANTKLSDSGEELRLLMEAEWEKAARGTDGRIYPWGNQPPNSQLLNYNNNVGDPTPVGCYPAGASPYGALDMAGNVWEWVADWYDEYYYARSPSRNPQGPPSGTWRVLRGGSWLNYEWNVRSSYRFRIFPDYRLNYAGFRCSR